MKLTLTKLLLLGVFAEVLIFLICTLIQPDWGATFQHAARYSGRLSAFVFLVAFYKFAMAFPRPLSENKSAMNWVKLFALVHVIHFGFLATNIYLNAIEVVAVRLVGGAAAYLMIVLAPFVLHRLKWPSQLVYYYYVSIVMAMTYVGRIKGGFEGVQPSWLHYVMLGVFILCGFLFALRMWKAKR